MIKGHGPILSIEATVDSSRHVDRRTRPSKRLHSRHRLLAVQKVATNESLSYESFLTSVFTSMGIPYSKPINAAARHDDINSKTASSSEDSLTPLSSNEQESTNSTLSKSSPPLIEEPPVEARVKRQKLEVDKSQYRRVSSNKLVRVSDQGQPLRKPTPPVLLH